MRWSLRRCALALATLLASGRADAQDAPPTPLVAFEWSRGPGAEACADQVDIAGRVEARLGRTVFVVAGGTAETIVSGRLAWSRTSPRWSASLTLTRRGEVRDDRTITSEARSCRALEDAVVLVLSMVLDSHARAAAARAAAPAAGTGSAPGSAPGSGSGTGTGTGTGTGGTGTASVAAAGSAPGSAAAAAPGSGAATGAAAAAAPGSGAAAAPGSGAAAAPGSGSGSAAAPGSGSAAAPGSGSAAAPGSGSAAAPGSGSGTAAAPGSGRVRAAVSRPWGAAVSVGPVATMGVLPGIAGGVRVAARAITPWRFAIELDAIALGQTTAAIEEGRRSFSAQMLAVSVCPSLLERARLAAGVCAGGEVARLHISAFEPAEGSGYTPGKGSASGDKLLAEALASTWLSVQVWRWLLVGASAAAIVNFTYYPFGVTLEDQDGNVLAEPEVHRMSWLSGQFELHASLELP